MNNNSNDIALIKLIVLLILREIDMPVTSSQLTDIVLENNLANYFDLQQSLVELEESNLIMKFGNREMYKATDMGIKTLELFKSHIDSKIKSTIQNYVLMNKEKIRLETQVRSKIIKKSNTEYIVNLKVVEKDIELINLSLNVVSSKQAKIICSNWEKKYYQVYDQIMNLLIKP
ncbi:DUF4364 family protein [Lutispora thermophila]|uniref:DUF4364 family protein n=1 Tax=Lutispora thermophila DSM 19022 TaxID=1122184 RepID=A0A1M6GLK1_9FIRM|nr:DUF4364 family protein [Lutispora thermophila]SHJ10822.1 protein of unknown function [Lutispora thermophila DSM 19022]